MGERNTQRYCLEAAAVASLSVMRQAQGKFSAFMRNSQKASLQKEDLGYQL